MDPLIVVTIILQVIVLALVGYVLFLHFSASRRDDSAKFDASLQERLAALQSDLRKELGDTRKEVTHSKDLISEHTIKTVENIKEMSATIHKIIRQQEDAQELGRSLRDLLQTPKLRGSYGEAVLEEMLEKVLPRGLWHRQYTIDGSERVDAAITFKDIIIPIDAKFPRDDYRRYLDAVTEAEKKEAWKGYEKAVRGQIKSIASKYIKPEKGTSEFALMFIPSEAIYYETIAEKNAIGQPNALYEYAQEQRVMPVSPNTFYAFLQIVILGIRNVEVIKNAKQLQEGLRALEKAFEAFYRKYEDIGRQLDKASESYRIGEKHIDRYKKHLDSTLKVEGFDDESGGGLPGD